tara:strand:+ start:115 stop:1470 length:1356 start_codon:yes stop_codon:yes gene_type:complete
MDLKNKIYIIILLGLFLSSILSFYYVSTYDVYEIYSDLSKRHQMIKSDAGKFWYFANELKKDINMGINFFKTGTEYRISYLPDKILYFLSSFINLELYNESGNVSLDKKKVLILIFQAIIYYLSVLFFYKGIMNIYPDKAVLFIICFLCFEPTLLLFHSSFWSESIFFSMQLVLLTLLIKNTNKFSINFIAGILLGLLLLQRSVSMFYIFPIILYFLIIFKKQFIKPSISLIIGYLIVIIFLGYHNLSRSGVFYVSPSQSKDGFYMYMLPSLVSKKQKISTIEASEKLSSEEKIWIQEQNLDLKNEKDLLQYYNYTQKKSLKFMIENPFLTTKHIIKKTMHFYVLDPLRHVHFFYKYEYRDYHNSLMHQKSIPFRIVYSLFIYLICLLGFFFLFKSNKNNRLSIILLSIIYFSIMSSWIGNTRYFTPCLIYLSILFGNGLYYLSNIKKIKL